jgi:16S rRNA (guanine527-N7)-methyltransferase
LLEKFVAFLVKEASEQNLVAASTLDHLWSRHIVDSAQLLHFAAHNQGNWIDLGSGAGFPGVVAGILGSWPVTLVESRAKRIDYLCRLVAHLDIASRITVAGMPLERLETVPYTVISARAFAPLPKLLEVAARFSTDKTIWLLPKGRNAAIEYAQAQKCWNIDFSIEQSITDAEAGILVGRVAGKNVVGATRRRTGKWQKWQ